MDELNVNFTNAEATVLRLQPGDVLAITLKSEDINQKMLLSIKKNLDTVFKNNKVIIFGVGQNDEVKFSTISEEPSKNYCNDCGCGKKEAYEDKYGNPEGNKDESNS